MFLQSVFNQGRHDRYNGGSVLDTPRSADTEGLTLSASKELVFAVEDYFWNQVGMFGGTLFRSIPVSTGGRNYIIDNIVSLVHNLYVINCRDFDGEVQRSDDLYQDWNLTSRDGITAVCESPVLYNSECIKGLCSLLGMSPKRIISVVMFTERTRFVEPPIRVPRLRVEHLVDLRKHGLWDVGGVALSTPELSSIDKILSDIMYRYYEPVQLPVSSVGGTPSKMNIALCPECGHPLKLAITSRGIFATCITYPVCHFSYRVHK